ncbi:hypothetical protein TWF694_011450 [Orbilia ellipsospora]|uniref:Cytochrome P450 n=1 Tax=Orbilia ellipsospora TaxID=2528407 RepID=A0AAV9X596_9PEZI
MVFSIHDLHQKYGPYVRVSPTQIAVADLPSVLAIHSQNDPYDKTEWYKRAASGVDTMAGFVEHHRYLQRRKALGTGFSNSNLKKLEPVVQRHITACFSKIKAELEATGISNVLSCFRLMTTDVIGELCYGINFGLVENGEFLQLNEFAKSLYGSFFILGARAQMPVMKGLEKALSFIPHPLVQWFLGCNRRIEEYGIKCLDDLQREIGDCKDSSGKPRPSIFTQILDNTNNQDAKYRIDKRALIDEAGAMLIVGSQTVALQATYTMWTLHKHKVIREKLRKELEGIDWDTSDEKLQGLPYMTAVLKEALRLYSPGQIGLARVIPQGGRQLGPYFFPAGTEVVTNTFTVHRNSEIFDEPLLFKPERWFNTTKEMESAMMAFGGISRICLGINLAMMELRILVATMFKMCPDLDLAESCTDESMEFENYLVLSPKGRKCEFKCSAGGT